MLEFLKKEMNLKSVSKLKLPALEFRKLNNRMAIPTQSTVTKHL